MTEILSNILLTSVLIGAALWIAKTNPLLGGFILSLPLTTLITLALAKIQSRESANPVLMAKSIFVGVLVTLAFFIPFLLSEKLKLGFWQSYFAGFSLLIVSYFAHRWVVTTWLT
jgi:hypothetical protein